VIATAKGLGAGYAAIGAALCRQHVYEAIAAGSRRFPLGHTWNGAPLSCAVGLAVIDALEREGLVEHVRERGARLRQEIEDAIRDVPLVREVRGHGFLLGIEYADPRDGESFLPPELRVAGLVDEKAFAQELILLSTQPTRDGLAGDQTLFAPAFTATDEELAEMVERFARSLREVWAAVEGKLAAAPVSA
jgi:adenosylmethionine-8-amino-7-oxononanoate aminotransferase